MRLSIIVALAQNRVIGRRGELPWRLAADLQRFKRLTMGHPIIMGRKTYESIGRPLPGRTSIVVTRQPDYRADGTRTAGSLEEAIQLAAPLASEAFVIGGGEIYAQALPRADRLYLTTVQTVIDGDTFFPDWTGRSWRLVEEASHPADAKNEFAMCFQILERPAASPTTNPSEDLTMAHDTETELLDLSSQLLDSIGDKDWEAYAKLCDPSLTCFEPEALGQLVSGLEFHRFYFDLEGAPAKRNTTLASPHVRMLGTDAAVVSYIRLIQKLDGAGQPVTVAVEETRVWQRVQGKWKHVHFHRSAPTR